MAVDGVGAISTMILMKIVNAVSGYIVKLVVVIRGTQKLVVTTPGRVTVIVNPVVQASMLSEN